MSELNGYDREAEIARLEAQLARHRTDLADLAGTLPDDDPALQDVMRWIAEAEARIDNLKGEGPGI